MTKIFKIVKTLKESLIRNSSPKNIQQLSEYSLPSDIKGDLLLKRQKHRKDTLPIIRRSIWCLGSNLESSFLYQIPPTLTIARGLSSRYMIPPKMMSKMGSKKPSEDDRLTIIPAWMKKPKIKKFQDNLSNMKNKSQNISKNKNLDEFKVAGPKFKMTNLINKKSKSMYLMTESFKPKKIYKTVMNKIALPHFETKHLVLKKKSNKKETFDSQSGYEDSIKEIINENIPINYKLAMSKCDKKEQCRDKKAEKSLKLECTKNSPEPLVNIESNIEKSLAVVPEKKAKKPNKNDERSRIRRTKTNVIAEKDEKLLKSKAKHFEKPEIDMFIKKLAAKYGKIVVQKKVKPKRIYEDNRQRIKYDLDTEKIFIDSEKMGHKTKQFTKSKIETRTSHYSRKKLIEFLKKDIENSRILKKGNNLLVNKKTTTHKIEDTSNRCTILKKEDLPGDDKLQIGVLSVNKKANSAIKLNSKNGFLKDKGKHALSEEKRKKTSEIDSFENVTDGGKSKECTNCSGIKSNKNCLNKEGISNDHLIPYTPKNIGNSLIITNPVNNELRKEETSMNKYCVVSKDVKEITESKKNDNKTQEIKMILPNNENNNKAKLMISDVSNQKTNEYPSNIKNIAEEIKNKETNSQSYGTQKYTESQTYKTNDKGQNTVSKIDTSTKITEQMKYMKYTPDSPNHICVTKQRILSCKYKMSRGVHSDKKDISRESKKHLRNAQPDFKLNNKIRLNRRSNNSKITRKDATTIIVNNILPSKVEFIETIDQKLSVPSKINKFHCNSESMDYKVNKYDYSPTESLETKQSNNINRSSNDKQTENLEKNFILKKKGYQSIHKKKQNDVKNEQLINVNIVRKRFPPIVNFENAELTTQKQVSQITSEQPANHSIKSTIGENLPLMLYRGLDTETYNTKIQTYDSKNQSKPNSEISNQTKGKKFTQKEYEINRERRENVNINLHFSNMTADKEKSNCADTKTVQTIKLKNQTKDENNGAKYYGCFNNNETNNQQVTREMNNPGYNIHYSRRELEKKLPSLKNKSDKTINIFSKEQRNLELIENKEQQAKKEKKLLTEKETAPSIKSNNHGSSSEISDEINKMKSLKDNLKASVKENLKYEVQQKKKIEEIQSENHSGPDSSHSQQLFEINVQDGSMEKSKMWNSNIKKNILPTFNNENKTGINIFYYEGRKYQQKNDLGEQHQNMISGIQTKQHEMEKDQKLTSWMDKFHELVINKDIFNKKVKKNFFLMHGINKVSFLKVFEDIQHVTSEINISPKHIPMIAKNTYSNPEELSKNKINELQILENDLKTMLCQQLELYNREIQHKYSKTVNQNKNVRIYDLFDCTFILQHFNKNSLYFEYPKSCAEENLCQSRLSPTDHKLINSTTEKKWDERIPIQAEFNKDVSNMIKQIKTCGRLIVKQNPKDISFIEELDCRIPMKSTKSIVKESSADDIGSQNFNLINSKHMCFYSKYRMDCKGQNDSKKNIEDDQKSEKNNTSRVTETNVKQDPMTLKKIKSLESTPKSSSKGEPLLLTNMLTFEEIYDYNNRKKVGIEDKKSQINEFTELEDKEKNKIVTKKNFEKESSFEKKNNENTNLSIQTGSECNISNSLSVKENTNNIKIEPEVLHYMKQLDVLSSNNGFAMISNDTNTLSKNTNKAFFTKEKSQEKSFLNNNLNKYSNKILKNVSDHKRDEEIKNRNLHIKEISYSSDIKFLEKNTKDISDVINECRKGTFEYLTKIIKKHKMEAKNRSMLASSNVEEKSDEVSAPKINKDKKNFKKSSPGLSILVSPTLKMIDKNDKELKANSQKVRMNLENECKSGINSNQNDVISAKNGDSFNKLKVMKKVKELEKQLFCMRNPKNTLSHTKNEEFDLTAETGLMTSSNKNLKPNNKLKTAEIQIQNESSVNLGSMNKTSTHNINHVQKYNTESDSLTRQTTGMNNVKIAENSFRGICLQTNDLKKSKNIIKTTNNNLKNDHNLNRERIKKHLDSDNIKTLNNVNMTDCKVHGVLSKKYASRIQNVINNETQSNQSSTIDESQNHTKILKLQIGSRNSGNMTEKDMLNEVTAEEQKPEVLKLTTDHKKNEHETNINTEVDMNVIESSKSAKDIGKEIKNIVNRKININSNESYVTESIPTGSRSLSQLKIEAGKDKGMEKYCFKIPFCASESSKSKDYERKRIKSPLRKEIDKSVPLAKPTLAADCVTNSKLNQYLLKHKKQIEAITKDKRVNSIKNKLSNNLKHKDECKIIKRQSHTLMSLINAESGKKKSEDNKRDIKKVNEVGLQSQSININKTSIQESKEQTGSAWNNIVKGPEIENFYYSNCNSAIDSKSSLTKISTEPKKSSFDIFCSNNNFKQINEYKDARANKIANIELNFTQQDDNLKKEKNKEKKEIGPSSPLHCLKKNMKAKQKNKSRENPIYILKAQPKVEGFISQSLRSSNSQKITSSKIKTGTVKKRQSGHSMKHRTKSELKQSATCLKKKILKHRVLKTDSRFKIDQKQNQINMKLTHSNKKFVQKEFPLHAFQKEQKHVYKSCLLETPSRQVCGLTPPKENAPKEKPVMPKVKVTTKLIACTQKKDDFQNQNFKNCGDNVFVINKNHNIKPNYEQKPTITDMYLVEKGNRNALNLKEYQLDNSKIGVLKEERDQNINLKETKDLKSDTELIIDSSKPATGLATTVSDGNNTSKYNLITSPKVDMGFPSIVGNVVNNVKARIQNFLLADIAKSKLNRGIRSKQKRQRDVHNFKEKSSITKISKEKYGLAKLNQNTKETLSRPSASRASGTTYQVQPNKNTIKMKMKSEKDNIGAGERKISDLLRFKSVRNKQTCPQMSYSEVLNKFYAGCET